MAVKGMLLYNSGSVRQVLHYMSAKYCKNDIYFVMCIALGAAVSKHFRKLHQTIGDNLEHLMLFLCMFAKTYFRIAFRNVATCITNLK